MKTLLSRNTYVNVKAMLDSPDEESIVVGLTCIEQSEFGSNIMYIGLLFLECNVRAELWKVHAPETTKLLRTIGFDIMSPPITYKKLLSKALEYTKDVEDLKLFFDAYSLYLKSQLNQKLSTTDIVIDELIITIKTNKDEARTISGGSQGSNPEGTILRDVSDNAE
jgi:hypothetical protein